MVSADRESRKAREKSSNAQRAGSETNLSLPCLHVAVSASRLGQLEVGKSYVISGATVRPSRQSAYEVSPLGHDLIVSNETQFQLVTDGSDQGLPQHSLDLVPFSNLQEMLSRQKEEAARMGQQGQQTQGFTVDVIGIVVDSQPMQGQTETG